ncbi:Protochlorophyllide reductase B [Dorcoceras hygrometricum]|uniref:Protochlorophyllide reductase B n=1 Tax=Dorcoceras hygrometricum TaxID=472368 RepID=A0A2Z7CFY3_9LAMI|nr:Protochlorophyllide reductase B [Dorcoceras hygrometricum]
MVKRLATSPHDPLDINDSACKNQLVVVSVQYGPFNTYIPIRSTTIGKSRLARDPIAMHTSWRSNSDIASVTSIGNPRMKASGESSTTKHRLLHASGPHPIPPPNDPNLVSCITVVDFLPGCEGERQYRTLISLLGSLATMRRVVNYHSSWARKQQVELFDASGNPGSTAGRGFNPAGGAPGGG